MVVDDVFELVVDGCEVVGGCFELNVDCFELVNGVFDNSKLVICGFELTSGVFKVVVDNDLDVVAIVDCFEADLGCCEFVVDGWEVSVADGLRLDAVDSSNVVADGFRIVIDGLEVIIDG